MDNESHNELPAPEAPLVPSADPDKEVKLQVVDPWWSEIPEVSRIDLLWVTAIIFIFDYVLFLGSEGLGYAGLVASLYGVVLAKFKFKGIRTLTYPSAFLVLVCTRLLWQASIPGLIAGFFLVFYLTAILSGFVLHVPDLAKTCFLSLFYSWRGITGASQTLYKLPVGRFCSAKTGKAVVVPLAITTLFLLIFMAANPLMNKWVTECWTTLWEQLPLWSEWFPDSFRIAFWVGMLFVAAFYLWPTALPRPEMEACTDLKEEDIKAPETEVLLTPSTCLSTLVLLNILFVFYNYLDIRYLWLKADLPDNMGMAEYARTGAAWLTVALAMTSVVLGQIFRGYHNFCNSAGTLRHLAWIWAGQNFLLALATYRRLSVYINYNGLTFWRIVGIYGITLVVLGLVVVILKIKQQKNFLWMLRHQLKVLALGLALLFVTPTEYLEKTFNTHRILQGYVGAAYQVNGQPLTHAGLAALVPLLESKNKIIREGVAAMLLVEIDRLGQWEVRHTRWVDFELSTWTAQQALKKAEPKIKALAGDLKTLSQKRKALNEFTSAWHWPGKAWDFSTRGMTSSGREIYR